jgi:hypothetical protein
LNIEQVMLTFSAVKLLIKISSTHHELLVSRLTGESPLYYTLMNGVKVDGFAEGGASRFIEFICDAEQAERLVEAATPVCPEAAAQIKAGKMLPLRDQ